MAMVSSDASKWEALKVQRSAQPQSKTDLEPPAEVKINLSKTYNEYKNDYELWHPRLAHINPRLAKLAKPDLKDWPEKAHCDGCIMGKIHKFAHSGKRPTSEEMPWQAGEYFTCDLFWTCAQEHGWRAICRLLYRFKEQVYVCKISQG